MHTLWGYIAWRLAGEAGLKLVAEAEAARTNPGSELMVEVLKLAGPSVILLDELVAYARQLPDDRFEAFLSFIQSLTEAVKIVPNALLVGSLPEAQAEAGGAKGVEALTRLEKVFGRLQSPWMPASGDETYEIISRRLFQTLDSDGERARDETIKAFHDLYRKNSAEFPPEVKGEPLLSSCCGCPTLSTPNCSIACRRTGRAFLTSSGRAAYCGSWRTSSACCGMNGFLTH